MTAPRACLLIRRNWQYRTDAFVSGLTRAGFVVTENPAHPQEHDVLVLWNRMSRFAKFARQFEDAGARVIIAENGWIGRDEEGNKLIALCLGHHNGAGTWNVGPPGRWESFGIALQPWRSCGEHILVLPQRGIGESGVAMPHGWGNEIEGRLRRMTKRRIVVRRHPGMHLPEEPDFSGVHAVVTWASGGAIKAIVAGVPVFYEFRKWIGAGAAKPLDGADLENPFLGDRMPMLERLAFAQWRISEIVTGEAFRWLLASSSTKAESAVPAKSVPRCSAESPPVAIGCSA